MTITVNIELGSADLAVSDNVLIDYSLVNGDRYSINAASFYNSNVTTETVAIYQSPDSTSASGRQLDNLVLLPGEPGDSNALIAQGFETLNIIAVPSATGITAKASGNAYTGE